MSMTEQHEAGERLRAYIAERKKLRGVDRERIHGLHMGTERECELLLSDLEAVLAPTPNTEPAGGSEAVVPWRQVNPEKLIKAADALAVAAQSTGGVAGRGDGFVSAIDDYGKAREAYRQGLRIVRLEPEGVEIGAGALDHLLRLHACPPAQPAGGWQQEQVEALGEALFALSAKLAAAPEFLKDDANHAAYERVVHTYRTLAALTQPSAQQEQAEAVARRAYAMRPIKVLSQAAAEVTGKPVGSELTWDDVVKGGGNHDGLLFIVGNVLAALTQPSGERP